MKKVYLGIFMALSGVYVTAQQRIEPTKVSNYFPAVTKTKADNIDEKAVTVWSNDMSTQSDWVSTSISTTGNVTWEWMNDPAGIPDAGGGLSPFASASAANGFFVIDSDGNNTADNDGSEIIATLTSPTINLTGENFVRLQFQHNFRWWKETRKVRVSIDNGTTWTDVSLLSDNAEYYTTAQNSGNPEITTVDISALAGGQSQVKVQFYFQDHDIWGWYWAVDDVKIIRKEDYDLSGTYTRNHFNGYQYSQVPVAQTSEMTFQAEALNAGIQPLTNIKMTVDVNSGASSVVSNTLNLTASQSDTLVATYTPSAAGTYVFNQSFSMTETDDDLSNNLVIPPTTITLNNTIYASDLGAPFSALTISNATLNGAGVGYDIFQNATLYGIDFALATGTSVDGSAEVYAELREFNESPATPADRWTFVAETESFTVTSAADIDAVKTLKFSTPVQLTAGKTYLAYITGLSGTVRYAYSGLTDLVQTWINIEPTTESPNIWYYTNVKTVARLNFSPSLGVETNTLEGVKVYPNPSNGLINVSNDLNVENTIIVTDLTGKQVASKVASAATTIDLNNVGAGVYMVEISNLNGKKVERIVVQ